MAKAINPAKYWQGKKMPEEMRKKMSLSRKGKPKSEKWKRKIGLARLGKKRPPFSKEWKNKIKESMKINGWFPPARFGPLPEETKEKIRQSHLKKDFIRITPISQLIRTSRNYLLWRKSVFERDDYTCVFCYQRGGRLEADHIKPFALFPEFRFDIDNGRTLCHACHTLTENYAGRGMKRRRLWKNQQVTI